MEERRERKRAEEQRLVEEAVRRRERQESMAGREEMSRKLDRFLSLSLYSSSYLAMSL